MNIVRHALRLLMVEGMVDTFIYPPPPKQAPPIPHTMNDPH